MRMCHMISDNLGELHQMADRIGVNRKWFQDGSVPHYDICQSKRSLALELGAIEGDRVKIVELIRFWKGKRC